MRHDEVTFGFCVKMQYRVRLNVAHELFRLKFGEGEGQSDVVIEEKQQ